MFIASIVGSSWNAAEISGVPPIRSPADTNSVFGFVARSAGRWVARYSTPPARDRDRQPAGADPAARARLIRRSQVPVEVVQRQDLELQIRRLRLLRRRWHPPARRRSAPGRSLVAITPSAISAFLIFTLPLPLLELLGELDQLRRLSSGHGLTGLRLDLLHVRAEDVLLRLRTAARCRGLRQLRACRTATAPRPCCRRRASSGRRGCRTSPGG